MSKRKRHKWKGKKAKQRQKGKDLGEDAFCLFSSALQEKKRNLECKQGLGGFMWKPQMGGWVT